MSEVMTVPDECLGFTSIVKYLQVQLEQVTLSQAVQENRGMPLKHTMYLCRKEGP